MNSTFMPEPRRRWWKLPVFLALLLGLSGCQALTERLCELQDCKPASQNGDSSEVNRLLLDELRQLSGMNAEHRRQRYDALRPQLENTSCRMDTIRISMLYLTLTPPPHDDLSLITSATETCMASDTSSTLAGMAHIMHPSLKQIAENTTRIRELENKVIQEQTRNAALTEQLEALKAIERSLRDRGNTPD